MFYLSRKIHPWDWHSVNEKQWQMQERKLPNWVVTRNTGARSSIDISCLVVDLLSRQSVIGWPTKQQEIREFAQQPSVSLNCCALQRAQAGVCQETTRALRC